MSNLTQSEFIVMHRPQQRSPFTMPRTISVVEGPRLRKGTRTVVGFMPAGVLIPDNCEIPYFNHLTKAGYQRQPQEARVRQLSNDLRKDRTDLPTAVLLNIRNRQATEAVEDGQMDLMQLTATTAPVKFYVVDGQHRILALKELIKEDPDLWSQFMIPFVCLLGASAEEEMEQFYIVNSTAKSVKTDLALSLLRRRTEKDPSVLEALQERGRDWQVIGQGIVERLAEESEIWRQRIRLPSMLKGETTIPSASLVTSLKPLIASPYFGALKLEQQIKVIDAYWQGIREVLRPAFDRPTEHVIQKGVGVIAMHSILPQVIEIVRSRGLSTSEPASFQHVLDDPLLKLEGEDGNGEPVHGIDFWAAAPKGAAGAYSSSAGRRVLIAKLRQSLPAVEGE